MQIKLVDYNIGGVQTVIDALSVCRDKQCDLDTLDHCLTAKPVPHLSALEFTWFCFLVSGMSVKARIQLLRHRYFSTMERSTRHINMTDAKCTSLAANRKEGWKAVFKKENWFEYQYSKALDIYGRALELHAGIEDAAYLLPMATPTTFYIAGNGRAWYEYLQKRLCDKHVQAEHCIFAADIYRQLVKVIPGFKYAHPCRECKECDSTD